MYRKHRTELRNHPARTLTSLRKKSLFEGQYTPVKHLIPRCTGQTGKTYSNQVFGNTALSLKGHSKPRR